MKYFIYNYRDKKLKVFDAPIFSTESPDVYKEKVERSVVNCKPIEHEFAKNKDLYYFGTFDDVKGNFDFLETPSVLLHVDDVIPTFKECIDNYIASNIRDERNDSVVYRYEFNLERAKLTAQIKDNPEANLVAELKGDKHEPIN